MATRPTKGTVVGEAAVNIVPSFANFEKAFGDGLIDAVISPTAAVGAAFEKAGKFLFTRFTIPLAIATAANVAQFSILEREIRSVLTLFGTAGPLVQETFGEMQKGIREVSREVGGLESALADGLYQTISAGVGREDAFEFLNVAQMAAFADKTADVTTAVDGITTAINAFGLEASDAMKVSDIFFATVAKGKTTFGEIANTFGRVAPLAANAGVSLEETSAILGTLTLQGLKTSEAISFMRAAITGLLRPSEDMNKIFQDLGFTSAETAVPIIGLQAAFEAVSDSVHGSTSQLQELLGTSEGVTAALGITGDNAARFAAVMRTVENAAGSTENAFAIMDASMGRSFGRMTEAFSRLSNSLGELGGVLIAPIARGLVPIIDTMADAFSRIIPLSRKMGHGIAFAMQALNIPILKNFISGVTVLTLSVIGLLGVLGPLVFILGKFLILTVIAKAWRVLTSVLIGFRAGVLGAANLLSKLSFKLQSSTGLVGAFGKTAGKAATALRILGLGASSTTAVLAGFAAVAAVVVVAIIRYNDHMKFMRESNDTAGASVDRLAESLGVTLGIIGQLNAIGEEGGIGIEFTLENEKVIGAIERTIGRLGDAAAEDIILGIAWEFKARGADFDEVTALVDNLGAATGLSVQFDFDALGVEDGLGRVNAQLENAQFNIDADTRSFAALGAGSEAMLADAAAGFVDVLKGSDNVGKSLNDLIRIEEEFFTGDLTKRAAGDFFMDEVLKQFDGTAEIFGSFFGQMNTAQQTIDHILGSTGIENTITRQTDKARHLQIAIGSLSEQATEQLHQLNFEASVAARLTDEQLKVRDTLINNIGDVFQAGKDHALSAMSDIREGMLAQMPILAIYEGAVKQSFAKWKTGQDQFQADMEKIATLRRDHIVGLPKEVQAAFDAAPVSQQAWLTTLGPENLETAIVELQESAAAAINSADSQIASKFDDILVGMDTAMRTKFEEMLDEAIAAGGNVPQHFLDAFGPIAEQWATDAAGYITDLKNQMNVLIPGPTVGPITFLGGGTPNPTPFNNQVSVTFVNNLGSDIGADAQRAAALIGGVLVGG